MEKREAVLDETTGTGVLTDDKRSIVSGVVEMQKRVVKLTAKALADKLETLQNSRKAKLNKATTIRKSIQYLLSGDDKTQVSNALGGLVKVCGEAKCMHESLLGLLPGVEREKHETWFKAKMLSNDECIAGTKLWVSSNEGTVYEDGNVEDAISPNDSVSNVGSKHSSQRSNTSGKSSTTSSARVKVEASRAALIARTLALKEIHALEEQEQQLRRKREQLDLEAELAASNAMLAVYQASDFKSCSQGPSDGMASYFEREKRKKESVNCLNPMAKEYNPEGKSKTQNDWTQWPSPPDKPRFQYQLTTAQEEERHATNHQQISLNPPGDLLAIMHRQNDITAALVHQQRSSSLPPRQIPTFEGDPLQYRAFIKAFEQGVEEKAGGADCLYYLEQFTGGQPRELVRSCQHMAPERGYAVAKGLLQEHFGNQYKIAAAYMEKALAWQTIKSEDGKALQAYALFLRGCCNVMEELQYMQELDMPVNMRAIIAKLPFKMRDQWRTTAHGIMEKANHRAHFMDLVTFIERRVRILSDPLFGDIQDPSTGVTGTRTYDGFKSQPSNRVRGNIVATTVTSMDWPEGAMEPTSDTGKAEKAECLCCADDHSLEECKQFTGMKHKEKLDFLREQGVCFACLCVGHMSRDCERRLSCKECGKTHPTVLHIKGQIPAVEQVKEPSNDQPTSLKTCGHIGAGKDRCGLSILPVKVKSAKGNRIIQTYAFLDPGSSATFCSEHLMQKLNITGKRTNFLLQTMGQETVVPAYTLSGLAISGLDSNEFYTLPDVLTQRKMPVTADNMVTPEELTNWPYLSKVHNPSIEASVDLLIGTDAPKILEPWEVINSRGNGPYAIRTVLGWVVNGPLNGNSGASVAEISSATVNRITRTGTGRAVEQKMADLPLGKPALPPEAFKHHDRYGEDDGGRCSTSQIVLEEMGKGVLTLAPREAKRNQRKGGLVAGDIVVIMDPSAPRGSWPLGKVLRVFTDKKGLVRSVKLQTKSNILERPVTKLSLLHGV